MSKAEQQQYKNKYLVGSDLTYILTCSDLTYLHICIHLPRPPAAKLTTDSRPSSAVCFNNG